MQQSYYMTTSLSLTSSPHSNLFWNPEEDQVLLDHVSIYGNTNWTLCAQKVNELGFAFKNDTNCKDRYKNALKSCEEVQKKEPWSYDEDQKIIDFVLLNKDKRDLPWKKIPKGYLPGRNRDKIKDRWNNTLKINKEILQIHEVSFLFEEFSSRRKKRKIDKTEKTQVSGTQERDISRESKSRNKQLRVTHDGGPSAFTPYHQLQLKNAPQQLKVTQAAAGLLFNPSLSFGMQPPLISPVPSLLMPTPPSGLYGNLPGAFTIYPSRITPLSLSLTNNPGELS